MNGRAVRQPESRIVNRRRAVFLDLNGTLVTPVVVDRLSELRPVSGAAQAVARLSRAGYLCPVVTVQSRIEKGVFSSVEFNSWFGEFAANMAAQGADIQGPYICPHRFANPCACAKPQTLLYEQAAQELETPRRTLKPRSASADAVVWFSQAIQRRTQGRVFVLSRSPTSQRRIFTKPLTGFCEMRLPN